MQRLSFFDFLKGAAIWLVAFGHCISAFYPNWTENSVALAIIAFHMPLFMLVSGRFFLGSVSKVNLKTFVLRRFTRLYLPSLFWGLFNVLLIGG